MNKNELYDKLHLLLLDDEDLTEEKLKSIIYVSEGNNFDNEYLDLLIELITYLYCKNHSLDELIERDIPRNPNTSNMTFMDFRNILHSYQGMLVDGSNEDYYNLILNTAIKKLVKPSGRSNKIVSSLIHDKEEPQELFKMYIPIDNSSLFLFSILLISKCEANKVDYNFKINGNPNVQLGNNVEITLNIKNSHIMKNIIEEIIQENPEIIVDTNLLPLVSYQLNDYIGVVPKLYDGEYEDKVCEDIVTIKNKGGSFATFTNLLDKRFGFYFKDIKNIYHVEENDTKKLQ